MEEPYEKMVTLGVVGTSNQGMKSLTAIILDATVYFGGIEENKTMGEVCVGGVLEDLYSRLR
jgi:hypothetical protein